MGFKRLLDPRFNGITGKILYPTQAEIDWRLINFPTHSRNDRGFAALLGEEEEGNGLENFKQPVMISFRTPPTRISF